MTEIDENLSNYRLRFDQMYLQGHDLSWFDKEIPSEIRDYIQKLIAGGLLNTETSRVLDLGCGRGQLLSYFEQQGFQHATGVDVSSVASMQAKQHVKRSNIVIADAIKGLPFQDNSFSLITELTVLSSLNPKHWPVIINEIYRVLDRGGFYISEIFTRNQSLTLYQPLVTRSVIPKEFDEVYGVTKCELVDVFGKQFFIKDCQPVNPGLSDSFYVLAQKL